MTEAAERYRREPARGAPLPIFRPHLEAGAMPFSDLKPTASRAGSLTTTTAARLSAFAAGSGNGAWPHLARTDVATRLQQLSTNPVLIDQAGLNGCGGVAPMYLYAKRRPAGFVNFAIDLYENGRAQFGTIDIDPGDLKNKDPSTMTWPLPPTGPGAPKALDWMLISSVLRSNSDHFDGSPSDTISAITTPNEMRAFLTNGIGYRRVRDEANLAITKGLSHLRSLPIRADRDILLLVNITQIRGGGTKGAKVKSASRSPQRNGSARATGIRQSVMAMFPDHWMTLEGFNDRSGMITVDAWCWGVMQSFTAPLSVWEDNYYGAVIGEV